MIKYRFSFLSGVFIIFLLHMLVTACGDTKQSRLESTTEITQNKHVKVLHYFVDDIKWHKWYLLVNFIDVLLLTGWKYTRKIGAIYFRFTKKKDK